MKTFRVDVDDIADMFGAPSRKIKRFKKNPQTAHKRSDGLRSVRKHATSQLIREA